MFQYQKFPLKKKTSELKGNPPGTLKVYSNSIIRLLPSKALCTALHVLFFPPPPSQYVLLRVSPEGGTGSPRPEAFHQDARDSLERHEVCLDGQTPSTWCTPRNRNRDLLGAVLSPTHATNRTTNTKSTAEVKLRPFSWGS